MVHIQDATNEPDLYELSDSDLQLDVSVSSDLSYEESDQRKLSPVKKPPTSAPNTQKWRRRRKKHQPRLVSPSNKENCNPNSTGSPEKEKVTISRLEPTSEEKKAGIHFSRHTDGQNELGIPFVAVPDSLRLQRPPPKDDKHVWGVIPRFKRVYQVDVDRSTKVFHCSCRLHEHTGIPCRHIACVVSLPCQSDGRVMWKKMKGFPLSSVKTFWWTAYYYYGIMSKDNPNYDPKTISQLAQMREMDLNGRGFVCENSLDDVGIRVPPQIWNLANTHPSNRTRIAPIANQKGNDIQLHQ